MWLCSVARARRGVSAPQTRSTSRSTGTTRPGVDRQRGQHTPLPGRAQVHRPPVDLRGHLAQQTRSPPHIPRPPPATLSPTYRDSGLTRAMQKPRKKFTRTAAHHQTETARGSAGGRAVSPRPMAIRVDSRQHQSASTRSKEETSCTQRSGGHAWPPPLARPLRRRRPPTRSRPWPAEQAQWNSDMFGAGRVTSQKWETGMRRPAVLLSTIAMALSLLMATAPSSSTRHTYTAH